MATANVRGVRAAWARHDLPWAVVLLLIGVFQVMRGAWADAAIFAVALALLVAGAVGRMPRARMIMHRPALRVLAPIAAALGVGLLLAPRHGIASGILLGGLGLVVVAIAWSDRGGAGNAPARQSSAMGTAAAAWTVIVVIAGAWEATAYLTERWGVVPEGAMPAISELLDPLLDLPLGQAVFLLLWLAAGVALLRRGWARGKR